MTQADTSTNQTEIDVTSLVVKEPTAQERQQIGYYWPFAVTAVLLGLDQLTKQLVEGALGPLPAGALVSDKSLEWLGGQIRIVYLLNKGASFGFLNNADVSWVFTALAVGASLGIAGWYIWRGTRNRWLQLAMGLILGGIVGNLLDRLFQEGGVTDIITIPAIPLFRVFNVADSGITVGVTIVIATVLLQGWAENRRLKKNAIRAEISSGVNKDTQDIKDRKI